MAAHDHRFCRNLPFGRRSLGRLEPLLDGTILFAPLRAGTDTFMLSRLAVGLQYRWDDEMFIGGTAGYVGRVVLSLPFALQAGVEVAWRL